MFKKIFLFILIFTLFIIVIIYKYDNLKHLSQRVVKKFIISKFFWFKGKKN